MPELKTDTVCVVASVEADRLGIAQTATQWPYNDISSALRRRGMYINQYGPPGLSAAMGIGGTGADHVAVTWQGMPVNAPAAGSADVSRIPAFFFDHVELREWPAAGLTIALPDGPAHTGRTGLEAGGNSLQNLWIGGQAGGERGGYRHDTRFFYQHCNNDFAYRDDLRAGRPWIRQTHNNALSRGIMHRGQLDLGERAALQVSLWSQHARAEIPLPMGTSLPAQARQEDGFTRVHLSWQQRYGRFSHTLSGGLWSDGWHYRSAGADAVAEIDSRMKTRQGYVRSETEYLSPRWQASLMVEPGAVQIITDNYSGGGTGVSRSRYAVGVSRRAGGHTAGVRTGGEWRDRLHANTTGFYYRYQAHSRMTGLDVLAAASAHSRLPDFNELYWRPGGNETLQPEQARSLSLSLRWLRSLSARWQWEWLGKFTRRTADNFIQWLPAEGLSWSPRNIRKLQSWNAEAGLVLEYRRRLTSRWQVTWALADARVSQGEGAASWSQAWYTPRHVLSGAHEVAFGRWNFQYALYYCAARYYDFINTLPAYTTVDTQVSYRWENDRYALSFLLSVSNLSNTQYQSVRAYAMPGRVIGTGISIQYKHPNKIPQ